MVLYEASYALVTPVGNPTYQHCLAEALPMIALHCRNAASSLDLQLPTATMDAAMAKRFATDSCLKVADTSLQLLGGYGYLQVLCFSRILTSSMRAACPLGW